MKKTLIFSDVHLKVTQEAHTHRRDFVDFLRQFSPDEFDRFVCLGDLFDFWFEYRHVAFSGYFEVLRAFAELHERGVELHLVCGNHDFWAGRFLEEQLGFHVHRQPTLLPFGERNALLVHGDGINPADWRYRFYKRFARNPLVIRLFRLIHPDWAMAIAQGVSHGSRTYLGVPKPEEGPEACSLREFARETLARGEAGMVLCGHAHAQTLETLPTPTGTGLYLNPGDWFEHRDYAIWDGKEFLLHHGETSQQ